MGDAKHTESDMKPRVLFRLSFAYNNILIISSMARGTLSEVQNECFCGRSDVKVAIFHTVNFCQDEFYWISCGTDKDYHGASLTVETSLLRPSSLCKVMNGVSTSHGHFAHNLTSLGAKICE